MPASVVAAVPRGMVSTRGWAAVGGCVVIAVVATVVVEYHAWWPAPVALLFVGAGTAAFAMAGALVRMEGGQGGNAALLWWSAALFLLDKAFGWPSTPLIMIGQWFGWLFAVTLAAVLLRYPRPRLATVHRRMLVVAAMTVLVARTGAVLTRRQADLLIHTPATSRIWWPTVVHNPALSAGFQHFNLAAIAVGTVALEVALVRRVIAEGPSLRGEIIAIVPVTAVFAAATVAHPILLATVGPTPTEETGIAIAQAATILMIPLIFVAGAVRRASRDRVADLVLAIEPPVTSAAIRGALRQALSDPPLEIYYAATGDNVRLPGDPLVDGAGRPAPEPQPNRTRLVVGDGPAVIDLDTGTSVRRRPLVEAALAASALAISHTRLEVSLRMQLAEVRASRARIVEATLAERRRIERDLHDGIQQALLALGATIGQLAQRATSPVDLALVQHAREELRTARRELADLAQGLHPGVLAGAGLGAAVESVADRLPVEITLTIPGDRWPADLELIAYYIICEGLTNVVKHAQATAARVTVVSRDGWLAILIADNGRGGATVRERGGLAGLRERAAAAGGELTVESDAAGHGTRLTANLPCG